MVAEIHNASQAHAVLGDARLGVLGRIAAPDF
jgi:hypothetical protein